jgi:hypothetical protein
LILCFVIWWGQQDSGTGYLESAVKTENILRDFTPEDKMGFAGAGDLPDGTPPQIAELGEYIVVVAGDDEGQIVIHLIHADGEEEWSRTVDSKENAIAFVNNFQGIDLSPQKLQHLGFQNLFGESSFVIPGYLTLKKLDSAKFTPARLAVESRVFHENVKHKGHFSRTKMRMLEAKTGASMKPLAESVVAMFESDGDTYSPGVVGKVKSMGDKSRTYTQYSILDDNTLAPTRKSTSALKAGVYEVGFSYDIGIFFAKKSIATDELLKFEDSRYNALLDEIKQFWGLREDFAAIGYTHKRGLLVYGAPGVGKSCLLKLAIDETVANDNVVFFCKNFDTAVKGIKAFREVEPDRNVMFVFEDIDEIIYGQEHSFLEFMDGDSQTDHTLLVCTTNYPEKIPPRVMRAGRLDTKVEVFAPPADGRRAYFTNKLPKESAASIDEMVAATDDFSFAECREFLVNRYLYKHPTEKAAKLVRSMDRASLM